MLGAAAERLGRARLLHRRGEPSVPLFGFQPGHIYIPKWVLLQGPWQNRGSLRDVLRHEFGHALAYYHPGPICRSRAFTETFGGRYEGRRSEPPADGEDFVSEYAMSGPAEDFAETFACWLRSFRRTTVSRFGPASPRSATLALQAKFSFVRGVCRRIAR